MTLGLCLLFIVFGLYGWLASVELGIATLKLGAKTTLTRYGIGLLRPLWLVTNGLLIAGIGCYLLIFSHAAAKLAHLGRAIIAIGVFCLVLRMLLILALFYGRKKPSSAVYSVLFIVVSLTLPLAVGALGAIGITGGPFWQTANGWLLMSTLAIGVLTMAATFVYYIVGITPHGRVRIASRVGNVTLGGLGALWLQHSLAAHYSHLISLPLLTFNALMALLIFWQLALYFRAQERYMFFYLSVVSVVVPLLLALANRPYIVFPDLTLKTAYDPTNAASGIVIIASAAFFGATGAVYWLLLPPAVRRRR